MRRQQRPRSAEKHHISPRVRSSPKWQQEEPSHSYQLMQISQQSSLNQGFRVNIWGQVEFGRLDLASSKHHTIMSIVTVDWSRFVMPLIKFYAKWIQSKTSKSFGCSDWYHRSCAFIPSQKRETKRQLKCLSECAIADTAVPAFQSFPLRTAQLQSSISLALRKGSGFTSAMQVLCTLRNEECIMCFKGRGLHKTKPKNQTKPNKKKPKKPINSKQKTKEQTTTTKKTWLWTGSVWECSKSFNSLQSWMSPGKKWTAGQLYPYFPHLHRGRNSRWRIKSCFPRKLKSEFKASCFSNRVFALSHLTGAYQKWPREGRNPAPPAPSSSSRMSAGCKQFLQYL